MREGRKGYDAGSGSGCAGVGQVQRRGRESLIMETFFAGGRDTTDHLAECAERKAVLFEEIEHAILKEDLFRIQAFLTGEQDNVYVGVYVTDVLQGIQAIHFPIQVIIQDDDAWLFV